MGRQDSQPRMPPSKNKKSTGSSINNTMGIMSCTGVERTTTIHINYIIRVRSSHCSIAVTSGIRALSTFPSDRVELLRGCVRSVCHVATMQHAKMRLAVILLETQKLQFRRDLFGLERILEPANTLPCTVSSHLHSNGPLQDHTQNTSAP